MIFSEWVKDFETKFGRKPSAYIAGPMTAYKDLPVDDPRRWGRCYFDAAARYLRDRGMTYFSPIEEDDKEGGPDEIFKKYTWEQVLAKDLVILKDKDFVLLLPRWTESDGATLEASEGQRRGKPLFCTKFFEDPIEGGEGVAKATVTLSGVEPMLPPLAITLGMKDPDELVFEKLNQAETRVVSTTGGQKGSKLARFDLIPPVSLWELAEHYGKGCSKYAPRNWERGYPWSLTYAAMVRHAVKMWEGEDRDPETGTYHEIAVAWHAFALRHFRDTHPEFDDRPSTLIKTGRSLVGENPRENG